MTNIFPPESMLRETSTVARSNGIRKGKNAKRAGGRGPYLERDHVRRGEAPILRGVDGGERGEARGPRSRSPRRDGGGAARRGGESSRVESMEDLGVRAQSRGARVHGVIGSAALLAYECSDSRRI
ncbi:hypothetical protein BT93_F0216 [Corymbia citriodora subsp. variegata]|nr:hypothetical protein BT93_F0216 [Corymbia citriodora subsp. variegata]